MKANLQTNNTAYITSEACAWIAQLETGDLLTEDFAAFREWISRSPAHQKEIGRLANLSNDINILTEMKPALKIAANEHRNLIANVKQQPWLNLGNIAAGFALAVTFFSALFFVAQQDQISIDPALVTTVIGSHREVKLSDGSIVKLNTDSELEIDFSTERRKVRLLRGEAFFQVAHNPERPFIVYAGEKSVKAIGTAFVVRHLESKFEVTVTEGRIELAPTPTSNPDIEMVQLNNQPFEQFAKQPPNAIYLNAGETIAYQDNAPNEVIEVLSKTEIKRKLSWQDGILDFSDTPLVEVIEDLSRYTSLKIEIIDPDLADVKLGGLFRVDELEALFNALETSFDINVEYAAGGIVRLTRISEEIEE